MEFPDSYFEDEVRDGFLVPGMMKRSWAAHLEILGAVKEVCKKHGISYFAEWGTLLGAIRNGGIIPWDDDLDICMKRTDYEKFVEIAPQALPEGYSIMSYRTTDTANMVTKILNYPVRLLDEEDLPRFHGYPFPVVVDLFVMDFLPGNREEERSLRKLIGLVSGLVYRAGKGDTDSENARAALREVEEKCGVKIDPKKPLQRQLLGALEKMANDLREEDADDITGLFSYFKNESYRMPKGFFDEMVNVPFEVMEIAVPAGYDALLSHKYGSDWMKLVRAGGSHGYPAYRGVYERVKKTMKIEPLRYKYSQKEMEEAEQKRVPKETLRTRVEGFLPLFGEAHAEIKRLAGEGDLDSAAGILGECQDAAIQLGTMIEEEHGEGHPTVGILETYCETLFHLHQVMAETPDALHCDGLNIFEEQLGESIAKDLKERKEVVFIPYKASYWGTMERFWREAADDGETDVYVIPAPYYYKDALGRAKREEPHFETDYPEGVTITSYEEYNFEVHRPDVIVIQCPYDEYHYGLMIHPFFFAKNLKQYTGKLVYIPPLIMDEIGPEDERARATLQDFCNTPGVAFADVVLVQSEQMKEVYVELLTEFAGEETKTMWEEKILGLRPPSGDGGGQNTPAPDPEGLPEEWLQMTRRPDGSRKKVILYATSASILFEYGEQAVGKMKEVFCLFCEKQEEAVLLWRPDPNAGDVLEKNLPAVWQEYQALSQEYRETGWGIYDDSADLERAVSFCNAFYGDSGVAANMCHVRKKPVMLQGMTGRTDGGCR